MPTIHPPPSETAIAKALTERGLAPEDCQILVIVPLLHSGWECDHTLMLVRHKESTIPIVLGNVATDVSTLETTAAFLQERLAAYHEAIQLTNTALRLIDGTRDHAVTSDPEVLGGRPVFRGTRVPIEVLFENLQDGMSIDQILEAYPSLNRQDLISCLSVSYRKILEGAIQERPVCYGTDDCSSEFLARCPWSRTCGEDT